MNGPSPHHGGSLRQGGVREARANGELEAVVEFSRRPEVAGARLSGSRLRHADPPPPAVLGDGPVLLLDFAPAPRRPALVGARLLLGDQALVAALYHLLPRLQPVRRQPPHGEQQLAARRDVLQPGAAITERAAGEIPPVVEQQVEDVERRRRGGGSGVEHNGGVRRQRNAECRPSNFWVVDVREPCRACEAHALFTSLGLDGLITLDLQRIPHQLQVRKA
jgi:hypothetical protein